METVSMNVEELEVIIAPKGPIVRGDPTADD